MLNFLRWFRSVVTWLAEARHALLSIAVVAIAVSVVHLAGWSEPAIRLTGMSLQLLGVGTVAWGIAETRSLFGHASLMSAATLWIRRFPRYSPRVTLGYQRVQLQPIKGHAYGAAGPLPELNRTVEERLTAVGQAAEQLSGKIVGLQRKLEEHARSVEQALTQESSQRLHSIAGVLGRLETTATGGIHITAIGAVWLFVGVMFGTLSPELATLLK